MFTVAVSAASSVPGDSAPASAFHLSPQPYAFLEAWARYDACWYVAIAEHGYGARLTDKFDMRPAFFPLFPALIAGVGLVAHSPVLAGLIVSNVCYFIFLTLLWRIVRLDWGPDEAWRTVWIYLLFPSAFFLSGVYSESVLLALVAGAVFASRRRHWRIAGVLASFAVLARPIGFIAVVPVLVGYLTTWRGDERQSTKPSTDLPWILGPSILVTAGYLLFAAYAFGDPLAAMRDQQLIRGSLTVPWQPIVEAWRHGLRLHAFEYSLFDATLALAAVAALPLLFTRVPKGYAWYGALIVTIPLCTSLISFSRLLLPSFPHAILLARSLGNRTALWAVLGVFGLLQAALVVAFATWNWVA